ncbi:MAG: hypothetical protein SFW08_02705 [Gemmatimonadaceae bacterium]|nr:hypothetical protein [Gemmatimonadaceae bacterium]
MGDGARHITWAMLSVAACGGGISAREAEEPARRARAKEAMIAEARAAAREESLFVAESIAFVSSFTVDTVAAVIDSLPGSPSSEGVDEDGAPRFYARSTRGALCGITGSLSYRLAPGDTLRCQWIPRP